MVLWFVLLVSSQSGNEHREVRRFVKLNLLSPFCANACEGWLNGGSMALKRARRRSIAYETAGTCDGFSDEQIQNTGTFIVVKSSAFVKSTTKKNAFHAQTLPTGQAKYILSP